MINIKELSIENDVNRKVIYSPEFGEKEEGRITSWNDTFIFVDYDNTGRGQATRPSDLEFIW